MRLSHPLLKLTITLLIVFCPVLSWAEKTSIEWNPEHVKYTIGSGQGSSDPVIATFTSTREMENVTLVVAPELSGFVTVEPAQFPIIQPNTTYSVKLGFSLPAGTPQGSYTGALHVTIAKHNFEDGDDVRGLLGAMGPGTEEGTHRRTIPEALKIVIDVVYGQNMVGPATAVLSVQTQQFLSSISADRSTLTFSQITFELVALRPGTILILPDSPTAPGGFIGKVTGVVMSGSGAVVQTVPASLADAMNTANVSISRTLTMNDLAPQIATTTSAISASVIPNQSVALNSTSEGFSISLNHVVLYDAGGGAQVTVDGSLSINPSFTFNCSIQGFSLKQLSFVDTTTFVANVTVNSNVEASLSKKFDIPPHLRFSPITVWAGFVPVVIIPDLVLTVGIDGSVSVGFAMSVTQAVNVSAGLSFDNGNWQPISQVSDSFTFQPPQPAATAAAKAFLGPQLNLLIYGVVGPFGALRGFLELDLSLFSQPQYQLFAGIEGAAGVRMQVLDKTIADYEFPTLISFQHLLIQGNFPPVTISVSPTPLVGPTSPGVFFTGTFVISGLDFQGGFVTTDGPLLLTGVSTVNSTGTTISQGYSIGCCAPQQGQIFHLFVKTAGGSASIADTITLR